MWVSNNKPKACLYWNIQNKNQNSKLTTLIVNLFVKQRFLELCLVRTGSEYVMQKKFREMAYVAVAHKRFCVCHCRVDFKKMVINSALFVFWMNDKLLITHNQNKMWLWTHDSSTVFYTMASAMTSMAAWYLHETFLILTAWKAKII